MMLRATATAACALALACAAAPEASAGTDSYLQTLAANGVKVTDTERAVKLGRQLCAQMYDGVPREVLSARVHDADPTSITGTQADIIAFAAQHELCPDTAE